MTSLVSVLWSFGVCHVSYDIRHTASRYGDQIRWCKLDLEADLPGFDKKDINIDINGDYLTIKAERDLDFVEVIDRRAACMEPVSQQSGYHYGYYIAPKDYTTAYYFHKMPKGTHIIETEYYIDRKGTYETGSCKAQCAYAPEFSATGKALKLVVSE